MTTPDGKFSPQLWVQRVVEGSIEQEYVKSSVSGSPCSYSQGGSQSSSPLGRPEHTTYSYSPNGSSRYSSPSQTAPNNFNTSFQSRGSPGSSYYQSNTGYSPPHIESPSRPGSWQAPRLPPQGYRYMPHLHGLFNANQVRD